VKKLLVVMLATIIAYIGLVACNSSEEAIDELEAGGEIEEAVLEDVLPENSSEVVIEIEELEGLERPRRPERQGEESFDLVGGWLWVNGPSVYVYFFDEDGLGARGFVCDGLNPDFEPDWEELEWVFSDGSLTLEVNGLSTERWSATISGDMLTLTSEEIEGLEYTYVRVLEPEGNERQYDELVGVWMWEEDLSWFYEFEFFLRGGGSRPAFPTGRENFEWLITADGGLLMHIEDGLVEMWSYAIEEGVLTLTSRQIAGLEYRYILDGDGGDRL